MSTGRAHGQGGGLLGPRLAEHAGERAVQPVGIVALHRRRGVIEVVRRLEARGLVGGQGAGPVRGLAASRGDTIDGPAPGKAEHADTGGARAVLAHHPGQGATTAHGVEHQAGDGRPVARAGEAVRLAPGLHGQFRGFAARFDVGDDFYGGRQPSGVAHQTNSAARIIRMPTKPTVNTALRRPTTPKA
jgi:hypothetical protein